METANETKKISGNIHFFSNLPDDAKIWIYQSNRQLSDEEVEKIQSRISAFVQVWTSHSRKVMADGAVAFNRFVILAADEAAFTVSGCAIDSSVHFVRELEHDFNLSLFDRLSVAYLENGAIRVAGNADFQQMIDSGVVQRGTLVFNNTVSSLKELRTRWITPVSESWHARVFSIPA